MSDKQRQLNSRPYTADYVALELEQNEDGEIIKATPWFALEDVTEENKHNILMYTPSEYLDNTKIFDLDDLSCAGRVSDFYDFMVERAGLSSNRMMNVVFGEFSIEDYDDSFGHVFDAACRYYAQDRLNFDKEYVSRFEATVLNEIPEEQLAVNEPEEVEPFDTVEPNIVPEAAKKSRDVDISVESGEDVSTENEPEI
jgi:hypothetical protein